MSSNYLVFLFFASLVLSFLLTPFVLSFLKKLSMTDGVNERSAHSTPVLRGGGLIFILSFLIVILVFSPLWTVLVAEKVELMILFAFFCSLIGFIDDRYDLPAWLRLLAQLILVAYPAFQSPVFYTNIPSFVQHIFIIISWVWFINLFNFMDGIDGYAAQEAFFILTFIAIAFIPLRSVSLVLIASVLGFLRVNRPRARVFMGDLGSYFLGYLLFGFMLHLCNSGSQYIAPCLIVSLLFTLDASHTIMVRLIKKEPLFQPHRAHWYQRLYNLGKSHGSIFYLGVFTNFILLSLSLSCYYIGHPLFDVFFSLVALCILALLIKRKEKCLRILNKR